MKLALVLWGLALLALTPGVSEAVIIDYFYTDGTIQDGDVYDIVHVMDDATVDVLGGQVNQLRGHASSTQNLYAGSVGYVSVTSTSVFNLQGILSAWVDIGSSATFNINTGIFEGQVMGSGGRINVNGGVVDFVTDSYISNFSVMDIYGGEVAFDGMMISRQAVLNVYGGNVAFERTGWGAAFGLSPTAAFNVYYSDIILGGARGQIAGYHLLDGSEFLLDQFTQEEIDLITFIPEPATFLILATGGILLRRRK